MSTASRPLRALIVPFFAVMIVGATACSRSQTSSVQHGRRTERPDLAACADLMALGETAYRDALRRGYEPTSLRNRLGSVLTIIPSAGANLADLVRSPSEEMGNLGERQFTQGATGILVGEGCPISVPAGAVHLYFPRVWLAIDPEVRTDLARMRFALLGAVTGLSPDAQSIVHKMGPLSEASD